MDFNTANNIMSNINGWVHGRELGVLRQLEDNVRRTTKEFPHSHILGTYDDEPLEPHDQLYFERLRKNLTNEELPF
jgi:hypothetical protein